MFTKNHSLLQAVLFSAIAWMGANCASHADITHQQIFGNDSGEWKKPQELGID